MTDRTPTTPASKTTPKSTTTPPPPGWSNAPPHDGITSTEPPPEHIDMSEPGWSNGDDVATGPPPTVTALVPATAVIGDPSFTLHVQGTDFVDGAVIVFAAQDEPTTFVSATEVTTGVDMSVWLAPDVLPVTVRNPDGAVSGAQSFTFTA